MSELSHAASAAGESLIGRAFCWLMHHTQAYCVTLGASRLKQPRENLGAVARGPLPAEVTDTCDHIWQQLRGVTPNYNR